MSRFSGGVIATIALVITIGSILPNNVLADCPEGDLDNNCQVNLVDLFLFVEQWLDPPGGSADLVGNDGVDTADYAVLANNWLRKYDTSVVINEFAAVNDGDLLDEDGDSSDWIELYNTTGDTIDLEGWYLTDNASNLQKWELPDVQLESGGLMVLFASGKDRRDPESELHTNFQLSGEGEFLALVKPDGVTIAHAYDEYPQQFVDISYGLNTGDMSSSVDTILIPEFTPASALIPEDDSLGREWTELGFVASGWLTGTTGVGYDYAGLIGLDVSAMRYNNETVYTRVAFTVSDTEDINQLTLRMKYEDGFAAYLNGAWVVGSNSPDPNDLTWNSGATALRDDSLAVNFQDFDITLYKDFLSIGDNVLAIQGLNREVDSSDLLILPELVATEINALELDTIAEGYFTPPTPGEVNSGSIINLGPAIFNVTENPPRPADDDDLVITAEVRETFEPIASVSLHYRVMYGSETSIAMYDDGLHGDGDSGDDIYGATIPASASDEGQMVRWYVTAEDTQANNSRNPLYPYPTNSPQYYGTVVIDSSVSTQLPLIEWFVENVSASEQDSGTRGSVYYLGAFYDNILIHRRGGSTATAYGRVHQKFNFNRGYKFEYDSSKPRVNEFNLNHTHSDKAYLRQSMAFDAYKWCGDPSSDSFLMRGHRNGQFHGVFVFIEEPEEEMLEREGLDPDGALYKMYNTFNAGGSAEKKTRRWEGRSDLDSFCNAINNTTGTQRHNNIFDIVDLPRTLNYLAATILTHQNDHPHKNHYLYRDSDGSGEWFFMPWDHDLTWGSNWTGSSFHDYIYANDDQVSGKPTDVKPSHPFVGKHDCQEWNYHSNNLIDALLNDTVVREMFLRRLRTVMDDFLKAPGIPSEELFIENYIDDLVARMAPDAAENYAMWADPWQWGGQEGYPVDQSLTQAINILKDDYLAVRRTHLFVTHNVDNVGSYNISGSYSAEIPNSQPANLSITFDSYVEYNPSSGNQDEEYLRLDNNESYAVEISGWKLTGGVEHTFLPGTVIPSLGSLYVSPDVATFRARSTSPTGGEGNFIQGNYQGHLSSWGETINLLDDDESLVDSITYTGNPSDQQRYLRVTEMMYHPAQGGSFNEEEYEYIELININTSPLLLDEIKLTQGIYYTFAAGANLYLDPGDYILIVKNQTAFAERYDIGGMNIAPDHYEGYLDNGGENIKLEDSTNSTILEYEYNDNWYDITDGDGFSLTIIDPNHPDLESWDEEESWRPSSVPGGSPGAEDTGQIPVPGAVVINELLANSDMEVYDWIELYNTTDEAINIGGWFLSDSNADETSRKKYEIATNTMIEPNDYIVFYENLHFNNVSDPGCHEPFALSANGETVYLQSGQGGELTGYYEEEDFGPSESDIAFGRHIKSAASGYDVDFVAMSSNTPDAVNAYPKVGPIVINEIMYHPEINADAEYVELLNISGSSVTLYDAMTDEPWKFEDEGGFEFFFPTDPAITMANGERILLVKDYAAFDTEFGDPGGIQILSWESAGSLSNGGEKIQLSMPGDEDPVTHERYYIRVDRVNYSDGSHPVGEDPWPTSPDGGGDALARKVSADYGNDPDNWQGVSPSPGT